MSTALPRVQISDEEARRQIRHELGLSLIVEASAGTGKTTELVSRIVAVLQAGLTEIDKIVAVTFTHKAAGELKLRLRQGLDRARNIAALPQERANLEEALKRLEEASVGTIHSFCAQLLRERPVEAVVDPAFEELNEQEGARIYARAFRQWIQARLDDESPGLRRALTRVAWGGWDKRAPMEQLQDAGWKLIEWRDFPAPWRRDEFSRQEEIDLLLRPVFELANISAKCTKPSDNLQRSLLPVRDFAILVQKADTRDYDTVESLLLKLDRDLKNDSRKGSGTWFLEGVKRQDIVEARDRLCEALTLFKVRADADLAVVLREEMSGLVAAYDEAKHRAGKLDFVDLLIFTRDLIRDQADVRRHLQDKFTHLFVDEFQDTDPLQAEILLLLASEDSRETDWLAVTPKPGKLFVVGDPKQSIYKFRRADVVLYESVKQRLVERGAGLVRLTRSFRSVRPIQECVNAAFAPEMTGNIEAGQALYSPLEEVRGAIDGQPSVIALPAPKPYASRLAKYKIDDCLPDAIVAFVAWLLKESGWKVGDPDDKTKLVPVQSQHVAILFRRFINFGKDLTRDYTRGLEARGIPHLLMGSKSFHKREEIETLRAALGAIEWPEDELSVYATLKGSLFAIPDAALLRFRSQYGRLHPFHKLPDVLEPEFLPLADALQLIAGLHRGRNRRPAAETVNILLEATRGHAGFALRPAGQQILANVYRIGDLARSYEFSGGISFRGFVEELSAQAERAESAEAPVLEEGSEGVRLMTVHTAKGLEFPVVILADMTANLQAANPDRYIAGERRLCATRILGCAPRELLEHDAEEREREKSEGVRVAYVAVTRARDLLVVPVVGDKEWEGWVSPLNKALYPEPDQFRKSTLALGCPPFGDASVLSRPLEYEQEGECSVKPGSHRPRAGEHSVVWWDPRALHLGVEETFGIRQEELLADGPYASESIAKYSAWQQQRMRALERGGKLSIDIITASTAERGPQDVPCDVELIELTKQRKRPSGKRFGTLVHAILQDVEFSANEADIKALAAVHSRVFGASDKEKSAAIQASLAALAHPIFARARKADRCYRELPVLLRLDPPKILEGTIDLAFLEAGVWTIVDFKTDSDLEFRREHYENQARWYALALRELTGQGVRAILLSV